MSTETVSTEDFEDSYSLHNRPDSPKDADDHVDLPKRRTLSIDPATLKNGIESMKFSNGIYYGEFKDGTFIQIIIDKGKCMEKESLRLIVEAFIQVISRTTYFTDMGLTFGGNCYFLIDVLVTERSIKVNITAESVKALESKSTRIRMFMKER